VTKLCVAWRGVAWRGVAWRGGVFNFVALGDTDLFSVTPVAVKGLKCVEQY
jgi:hypothetical protein